MFRRLRQFLIGLLMIGLAAALSFTRAGVQSAFAQSSIQLTKNEATLAFPDSVTFHLSGSSSNTIQKVFLDYGSNATACTQSTARQEVDFTPGQTIDVQWKWDFHKSGNLPPGAQVWWQWELQDASGAPSLTDKQTLIITDNGYTWNSLSDKGVTLYWVEGDQTYGKKLLQIAVDSLDKLSKNAGIQPLDKVNLYIYPTFDAVRKAVLFSPEWTGGVAMPEYGSVVIGIPGADYNWANQVIPHELTHLVTGQITFNCVGNSMPTWLNEGLSVYSEGPASQASLTSLNDAARNGTLPSLDSLAAGFAANADVARLNYAQSGEVVRYLATQYGPDKISALLAAIQSGETIDKALQQVYSFVTEGLDALWRASMGFGPVPTIQSFTPTPTMVFTAVPTLAIYTSAFGKSAATDTSTPAQEAQAKPSQTPTPSATSAPSSTQPVPTIAPSPTPQQSANPLRCLGGSGFLFGLAALVWWSASKRKF